MVAVFELGSQWHDPAVDFGPDGSVAKVGVVRRRLAGWGGDGGAVRTSSRAPPSSFTPASASACAGVETGAVSPCHGQFRAEGKYFAAREQSDGTTVVVSTMNAPDAPCAD